MKKPSFFDNNSVHGFASIVMWHELATIRLSSLLLIPLVLFGSLNAHAVLRGDTTLTQPEQDVLVGTIFNGGPCSGTLLTNKWALTCRHCGVQQVVYGTPCASNANCAARGGTCLSTSFGNYCGVAAAGIYDAPLPPIPSPKDVRLVRLRDPLRLTNNPSNYSIAQKIYAGSEESLLGRSISVYGAGLLPPSFTFGKAFGWIMSTSNPYSYVFSLTSPNGATIVGGDSGGPGYLTRTSGFRYLTGVTATSGTPSQHDLPEVYGWIDNTLHDIPRVIEYDALSYDMALTSSGAYAVIRRNSANGTIIFKKCDAEPCDSRGTWNSAFTVTTSANSDAAVVNDAGRARVFVRRGGTRRVQTRLRNADGTWTGWDDTIGGNCTGGPAAHARPNANLVDLVCKDATSGQIAHNWRGNSGWSGWGSIGAPPPGILSGAAPAIVSTDANSTYVVVAGADGAGWFRKGVSGSGWGSWTSLQGANITRVAVASYEPSRVDVYALDSSGSLYHKIFDGESWGPAWTRVGTGGNWEPDKRPYAAAFSGHKARMNVGSIQGTAAHVQRYSDW